MTTIGTCSLCGGRVSVPHVIDAPSPIPSCEQCGALAAEHGPVIPMVPAPVCVPVVFSWPTHPWPRGGTVQVLPETGAITILPEVLDPVPGDPYD